jgi:hypothetical protein
VGINAVNLKPARPRPQRGNVQRSEGNWPLKGEAVPGGARAWCVGIHQVAQYSTDYWSGSGNRYDNVFLFITGFSMGNVLETYTSMPNGLPRGSTDHSIPAMVGVGLANDEYIVYDLS